MRDFGGRKGKRKGGNDVSILSQKEIFLKSKCFIFIILTSIVRNNLKAIHLLWSL